jgi:hypothetical protein
MYLQYSGRKQKGGILCLWFRAWQIYFIISNQRDAALLFTAKSLYMFRVLSAPIIRST